MLHDGILGVIARDEPSAVRLAASLEANGARVESGVCGASELAVLANPALDAVVLDVGDDAACFAAVVVALASDDRARRVPVVALVAPTLPAASIAELRASCVVAGEGSHERLVARLVPLVERGRAERDDQRASRELRADLRRAAEGWTLVERAVASTTHDVRAMCGVVVGYGANLRDEIVGPMLPAQRQHVESVLQAAHDVAALLDRLGEVVREQAGLDRVEPPPSSRRSPDRRGLHDVAAIVRSSAAILANVAAQKGIAFTVTARDSALAWCDALHVKQVVTNLLANALKFTPSGGEVGVEVRASSSAGEVRRSLELRVWDTGPGIPPAERERVFERGHRLARDAAVAGSGVGLAVVKEIVGAHGGAVRVEEAEGGGAAFRVTLPFDLRARAERPLLVIDDPALAERITRALAARGAESVRTARDAALADATRGCAGLVVVPRGKLAELEAALQSRRDHSPPPPSVRPVGGRA